MKNTKKRGFTIVELVIVIAVIAILASVLIPTFSGVVTKAKESAAKQNASAAWTAYLADEALAGNDLPNGDGCIKVSTTEGENTKDYYFEVKAGTFTGKVCEKPGAHDCYTIKDGKIDTTTTTHTYTATPAQGGGTGGQDAGGNNQGGENNNH